MTFNYPSTLDAVYAGNSVATWLITLLCAAGLLIVCSLVHSIAQRFLTRLAQKSTTQVDDIVSGFLSAIPSWLWVLFSFLVAFNIPSLPTAVDVVIDAALLVICVGCVILLAERVLAYILTRKIPRLKRAQTHELPTVMKVTIALVLWTMGGLLILSNLGVNVLSLVAGLGIGGIAVALALQNILSDMFSSYSLYLDQPFSEGDFIVVGENKGVVTKIGLKTTRLQSLQGEEVVISNQELTTQRVHNYKRMPKRRVVLAFGVTYDTPLKHMKNIPGDIQTIIEKKEGVTFDRAHFCSFGPSSLDFEVIYFINTNEYLAYMDMQQAINFDVMEYMEKKQIEFAYPTRTVYMKEG